MSYIQHKAEESLEDYLETILILSKRLSAVRSIDVATEMNFSKPSVSVAVKNMKNREYITVSEEGYLQLTDEGRKIAENVYERHTLQDGARHHPGELRGDEKMYLVHFGAELKTYIFMAHDTICHAPFSILRMAGAMHSAACTPTATRRIPLPLTTYYTDKNRRHHENQNRADDDCRHIFHKPCKH